MTRNTTGISMPAEMIENVDETYAALGYHSRSDFVRAATREKLEEIDGVSE